MHQLKSTKAQPQIFLFHSRLMYLKYASTNEPPQLPQTTWIILYYDAHTSPAASPHGRVLPEAQCAARVTGRT